METKRLVDQDLKSAMLAGDKQKVNTLRGIKSAILYAEVEAGKKEKGLDETEITNLLRKEAKKRQESAEMYQKGGADERADGELYELQIIKQYMPKEITNEELNAVIQDSLKSIEPTPQNLGKIIADVKQKTGGRAESAVIAAAVKQKVGA